MLAEIEEPACQEKPKRKKRWLAKDVGKRIRAIRWSKGKTLKDVADAMETTPQTVQRLETDNMALSVDWLERIAEALDVHPAELFSDHLGAKAEAKAAKRRLGMLRAAIAEVVRQVQEVVPELLGEEDKDAWPDQRVFQITIGGRYQDHMKLLEIRKPAGDTLQDAANRHADAVETPIQAARDACAARSDEGDGDAPVR